jgi:hypothetical protein
MLSIRYDALRPMVYTVRAGCLFCRPLGFQDWLEITRQVEASASWARCPPAQLAPLAQSLDADYLVIDFRPRRANRRLAARAGLAER